MKCLHCSSPWHPTSAHNAAFDRARRLALACEMYPGTGRPPVGAVHWKAPSGVLSGYYGVTRSGTELWLGRAIEAAEAFLSLNPDPLEW